MSYSYYPPPAPPPLTPPVPGVTTPPPEKLTVNGLGLTPAEFAASRAGDRSTRWIFVSLAVLGAIFGYSAAGMAAMYVGMTEGVMLTLLMLIALTLIVLGIWRQQAAARRAQDAAWRLYAAETEGGLVTTLYPDRVEQASARWQTTLVFNNETRYVENRDLMILENGKQRVVLRATDLTPEEAQAVYEIICLAVPPERQYATGRFAARRVQKAPPPFSTTPPVCYERFTCEQAPAPVFRGMPAGLVPWLLAACLVCAGMLTVLFAVTSHFFLDFLLFFSALFGVSAVAAWLILWRADVVAAKQEPAERTVTLSFTAAGLRVQRQDIQQFVAAADVHARRTENGARLFTPAGEFTFPWTVTANRQQLEWMLFGQRPASF